MAIKNIILDLDNTIVSSLKCNDQTKTTINRLIDEDKYIYYKLFDNNELIYVIFGRKDIYEFIDFLFQHFNVSVWTAASRCYASFVTQSILKKDQQCDYIFFDYHCKISKKLYNKQSKNLNILEKFFKLPGYNTENTIIIDDLEKICNEKVNYKYILSSYFDITKNYDQNKDNELKRIINVLKDMNNINDNSITNPITPIVTTQPQINPVVTVQPQINPVVTIDDKPIWEKLGWKRVASQSRPGQFSYENIYTEERIPDVPKFNAEKEEGKSKDLAFYD